MANAYGNVLSKVPENSLYIDNVEMNIDGYDFKKVDSKVVYYTTNKLSGTRVIPEEGYEIEGLRAACGIGNLIAIQVYKEGTDKTFPSGVSTEVEGCIDIGEVDIGDTATFSGWDYGEEQFSYSVVTSTGHEYEHDSVVSVYQPSLYDISGIRVNVRYYSTNGRTCWLCTAVSSNSFTVQRVTPADNPDIAGDIVAFYTPSSNTWDLRSNYKLNHARYFCAYNSYIYYFEYVESSGTYALKKFGTSSAPSVIRTGIPFSQYGRLCVYNGYLCCQANSKLYSVDTSTGSYTQLMTLPVDGDVVSDVHGTFLISGGNGVYKYSNGSWNFIEYLTSDFDSAIAFTYNNRIFLLYVDWVFHYDEATSLTQVYNGDLDDNANMRYQTVAATNSGYVCLIGTNIDPTYLECVQINVTGAGIETEYQQLPKHSANVKQYPSINSWTTISGSGLSSSDVIVNTTSCNGYLYIFKNDGTSVKYHNGSWSTGPTAPYLLSEEPSICSYDNKLYLFGSARNTKNTIDSTKSKYIYVYDENSGEFTRLKNSKNKYVNCPYVVYNSKVIYENGFFFLVGGSQGGKSGGKRFYTYDLYKEKWTKQPSFPVVCEKFCDIFVFKSRIHIYVGNPGNESIDNFHRIYRLVETITNAKKGTWKYEWIRMQNPQRMNGPYEYNYKFRLLSTYDKVYQVIPSTDIILYRTVLNAYRDDGDKIWSWGQYTELPGSNHGNSAIICIHNDSFFFIYQGIVYSQTGLRLYTISYDED